MSHRIPLDLWAHQGKTMHEILDGLHTRGLTECHKAFQLVAANVGLKLVTPILAVTRAGNFEELVAMLRDTDMESMAEELAKCGDPDLQSEPESKAVEGLEVMALMTRFLWLVMREQPEVARSGRN
jgi:hypothetical protein